MSKRNAYPISMLLKLKALNPSQNFEGEDKRVYEEWLEKEAENSLLNELDKVEKKPKMKKVKQVVEPTDTQSMDVVVPEDVSEDKTDKTEV